MKIALVAPDRTGKTTVANHLRDTYGFLKIDFTSKLKEITSELSLVFSKHLESKLISMYEIDQNKEDWRQLLIDVGSVIQYNGPLWTQYMLYTRDIGYEHEVFDNIRHNEQAVVLRNNGFIVVHLGKEEPRIDRRLVNIMFNYNHKLSVDVHCKHLLSEVAMYAGISEATGSTPVGVTPKQHTFSGI